MCLPSIVAQIAAIRSEADQNHALINISLAQFYRYFPENIWYKRDTFLPLPSAFKYPYNSGKITHNVILLSRATAHFFIADPSKSSAISIHSANRSRLR
jgi:hypothetical protein